jgi:hypothetical protein
MRRLDCPLKWGYEPTKIPLQSEAACESRRWRRNDLWHVKPLKSSGAPFELMA